MIYEDLRLIHEDVERLEQAIADRCLDDPRLLRARLARDHEIASFLSKIRDQSERALRIYNDQQDARIQELQNIGSGDTLEQFYKQLSSIKDFHKRNPNEALENLEQAYQKSDRGAPTALQQDIMSMFTGEEAFGRYLDLTLLHEEYLNLPSIKLTVRTPYLQYLDIFDQFTPPQCKMTKHNKMNDAYFSYVSSLAQYLESFMRKAQPLEELDGIFARFQEEFEKEWENGTVPGWEVATNTTAKSGVVTQGTGEGVWCADCAKEFSNDNTYKAHLSGKKHQKNAESRQHGEKTAQSQADSANDLTRLRQKAIAEREFRVRKLAGAMQTIRADTRANVDRKSGLTDRERRQEIEELYADVVEDTNMADADDEDDDAEGKIYNPLKLPLAWDGNPIPFWLYKLHGLGNEFSCEICGNYVYMGRRAFEKHFSEGRHVHGLKCLGITNTSLFREITQIEEAEKLWEKIKRDKKDLHDKQEDIVEMEDNSGVVMPLKVYDDLAREGLL